jgi:hypothetical protein
MRVVVAAAAGLLAMLGVRPSWGGGVEPVRLPDGSALLAVEFDRHVIAAARKRKGSRGEGKREGD